MRPPAGTRRFRWGLMSKRLFSIFLAGTALMAMSLPSLAQPRRAAPDPRIGVLEQQLRDVQLQLAQIKNRQDADDNSAALSDLKRSTSEEVAGINKRIAGQPRSNLNNGRFTVTSADGDFSLSLRGLVQFDTGYFAQGRNPPGVDLNSGTNFRRAQLGFQGAAWRDWSGVANDAGEDKPVFNRTVTLKDTWKKG